ncbi:MAG TPA: PLD nuclease N-terminal domain-containing protein [Candidatus Nanopelagicaceae bacterium]|nr:PLD nuclease N-terminal domain-containing protein [Candidatus Nanopelagicaceae bacterium]
MLAGTLLTGMTAGGSRVDVLVLLPLALIDLGLVIYSLVDLARRDRVTGGRKWPWAVVIIVIGTLGPIVYLVAGRRDD